MAKYVLGENAARKLRALFNGKMQAGRIDGTSGGIVDDADFLPPFTVQWAASLASGEGESATDGEWIVWLPGDQHVVIGETSVDLSEDLEDAEGEYPEGWYKLGDLLDRDEGGTLYLNVDVENATAEFSDEEGSAGVSVKIADAEVGDDGERTVKCYVRSSVVLDGGTGGGGGGNQYDGDDRSVTRYANVDPDPTQMWKDNYFHIYGFGTFTPNGRVLPIGTYIPPSDLVIGEDEATDVSFLCREGNSSSADQNTIAYKRLKIDSVSSPFKYTKNTEEDPQTHQLVTTHKLVNCKFYWQGEMKTIADFDVSGVVAVGSVYLVGTQQAPSAQSPDPEWTWVVATAEGEAPSGGKVLNYKLYDFDQGKPSVDYRTTFLSLEDHTQKAKVTVGKPDAAAKIELDASGEKPKLVVTDGNGHSISLDLSQVDDECSGVFGLHSISYKDKDGETQVYHGIFCDDIDLTEIKGKQKQADWAATTTTDDAFIKNKPNLNVDVVTGISMAVVDVEGGGKKLQATITKRNLASGAASSSTQDILTLTDIDVVGQSQYTSSHEFCNSMVKLFVLGYQAGTVETIFETTPHSAE